MDFSHAFTFLSHAGSETLSKSAISTLVPFVFVHHTLPAEPSHTQRQKYIGYYNSHIWIQWNTSGHALTTSDEGGHRSQIFL